MYYTWNSTKEAEKRDPGNEVDQNGHFFHVYYCYWCHELLLSAFIFRAILSLVNPTLSDRNNFNKISAVI